MHSSDFEQPTLGRGFGVFIGLAILTGLEFWVAVGGLHNTFPLLAIMALGKAALILEYYMHLSSTLQSDEGEQHG